MQNNKKKLAIGLFGIHYNESYFHFHGRYNKIDFRDSLQNYKEYIINYYSKLGYEIDFFISSYESDMQNILLNSYPAKKFLFTKYTKNKIDSYIPRNKRISELMNMILDYQTENNINYDLFIITRFDLKFKIPLIFTPDKVIIAFWLLNNKTSDDNIYIFEQKYLLQMKKLFDETLKIISHYTSYTWNKYIGLDNLSTLHKNKFNVEVNSVFRIVRNLGIMKKPSYFYVQNKNSNKFQNNHFFISHKNNPNQIKLSSRINNYRQDTAFKEYSIENSKQISNPEKALFLKKIINNDAKINFVFNNHNKKINEFIKKDGSDDVKEESNSASFSNNIIDNNLDEKEHNVNKPLNKKIIIKKKFIKI